MSEDPIGHSSGDLNYYRYVRNNPTKYRDPSGLLLKYACEKSELGLKDHVEKLRKNGGKGKELLELIEGKPELYQIKMRLNGENEYDPKTRIIYINPNDNEKIVTNDGPRTPSIARMIANELGHAAGAEDDGTGKMNNIDKWENPVMTPIDGLIRKEY